MGRFEINSTQALIRQFNGQTCTMHTDAQTDEPTIGVSGQTKFYNLTGGGGLFLADDEVVAK